MGKIEYLLKPTYFTFNIPNALCEYAGQENTL